MKKILPLFAVLVLLMSSLACQFSYNIGGLSPEPTLTPVQLIPTLEVSPATAPSGQAPANSSVPLLESEAILVNLYERISPGVVAIQTLGDLGAGLGSGVVYDQEGHIITNYHVVEGATDLEIDFTSGLKVHGQVVGTDTDSDLALIKVDVPADQLHPVPMGDSDQLKIGQTVVAIGNPFGLTGTMTVGIVSAKGRTLDSIRESPSGRYFSAGDLIQTDASINPGNSGGPLLNLNGELVGLNRAIRTTGITSTGDPINSGIGFAVSVNIIKRVTPYLISDGSYDYPYLGMYADEELSLLEQEALGFDNATGAYVAEVVPGGPADQAGIRGGNREVDLPNLLAGGDLITAVDGQPVRVFGDVLSYMMTHKSPGDPMVFSINRNGQPTEVTVTLGKRP
ncbi:MAG: trypsin-like peptidase domain-containing protein [Anaerolineaceae bacterium]|jgi:S1-C subfamily serine protease|nr:trypsin-like peptidase domain-containing protein [Anaerolineaceae bacterium]